jgi:AcrR family transcriptional regulator
METPSKRDRILKAATECFTRYGFKRTAMEDIAKTAGISRAALYLLFQNKEDIFRTLSEQLYEASLARAEAALQSDVSFCERLIAAFEGKDLELVRLVKSSPHGNELVDLNHAIAADIFQAAEGKFQQHLTTAIQYAVEVGELDSSRIGFTSEQCAALLINCTHGIKKSATTQEEYRQSLRHLMTVFSQALSPTIKQR